MSEQERKSVVDEDVRYVTDCNSCKKKSACISFFDHENAMMHKDIDNERAHRSNIVFAVTVMVIMLVFVIAYTVRMNAFIEVIKEMNADLVELASAKISTAP